jgi:hypothetical protein
VAGVACITVAPERARRPRAVEGLVAGGEHHGGAGEEGQPELQPGDVEGEGGHGDQPIGRAHARLVLHAPEEVDQRRHRDGHALGLAGRAGGVEHVGGGGGLSAAGEAGGRLAGDRGRVLAVELHDPGLVGWERCAQRALGHDQRHPRVGHHEGEALGGEGGIERDVTGAGLVHGEERHHQVERALQRDPHQHLRRGPQRPQAVGQPAGAGVQLPVGERRLAEPDRHRVGGPVGLRLHQLVQEPVPGPGARGVVDRLQAARVTGRQDGEAVHRRLRPRRHLLEEELQGVEPAPDGLLVEQVGVVLALQRQPAALLHRVEEEVEVLGRARVGAEAGLRPLEGERLGGEPGVEVEEDRDERKPAGVAGDGQRADQAAEGVLGVLLRVEDRAAHGAEQLGEGGGPVHRHADRKGVHAVADQIGVAGGGLAGRGDADHQVVLPGEPVQQGVEGGQQRDEEAGPGPGPGLLHRRHERGGQLAVVAPGDVGLDPRAGPVGGELQHRERAGEARHPVPFVGGVLRRPLPREELLGVAAEGVGRGQRRGAAQAAGGVELGQVAEQDAGGEAVADDVVRGQHQEVAVRGGPDQVEADQRPALQVERGAHPLLEERRDPGLPLGLGPLGQVEHLQGQGGLGRDAERGAVGADGRPGRLVPGHQVGQGGPHRRRVEAALKGEGAGLVEGQVGVGAELDGGPDLPLRLGRRGRPLQRRAGEGIELGRSS